jgi:chromosome segregation ATPase
MRNTIYVLSAVVLLMVWGAGPLVAGDAGGDAGGGGGGAGGGGGGGGRRGNWDPEAMRQRMLDRVKESLGSTDEEWKVLQPKVEAVQKLTTQGWAGMFGRRRGPGGPGGDAAQNANQPEARSEVDKKTQELQALTDNKDADPKAVAEKLKELREAREKAKVELKKAQDELRELLTPRQEAVLVLMRLLD